MNQVVEKVENLIMTSQREIYLSGRFKTVNYQAEVLNNLFLELVKLEDVYNTKTKHLVASSFYDEKENLIFHNVSLNNGLELSVGENGSSGTEIIKITKSVNSSDRKFFDLTLKFIFNRLNRTLDDVKIIIEDYEFIGKEVCENKTIYFSEKAGFLYGTAEEDYDFIIHSDFRPIVPVDGNNYMREFLFINKDFRLCKPEKLSEFEEDFKEIYPARATCWIVRFFKNQTTTLKSFESEDDIEKILHFLKSKFSKDGGYMMSVYSLPFIVASDMGLIDISKYSDKQINSKRVNEDIMDSLYEFLNKDGNLFLTTGDILDENFNVKKDVLRSEEFRIKVLENVDKFKLREKEGTIDWK